MIVNTLSQINIAVGNFSQTTYGALATDIGTIGVTMGTIGLVILAINMVFQIVPSHPGALLIWAIKFMIVLAAASSWAFFGQVYNAVSQMPGAISAQILGGNNMEAAMQAAVDELWTAYDTLWGAGGTFAVGTKIGAILIAVVAIFLTVAVVLVIGISQMGLALSLGLAPIFIIGLLFRATSDLFASWTKFTLSFILILVLTATVISFLLSIVASAVASANGGTTLQDFAPLVVQAVAAIFFLMMVPNYAMALAGSLATSGISIMAAGAGAAGVTKSALQSSANGMNSARTNVIRARSAAASAREIRTQGGSMQDQARSSIQQWRDDQHKSFTRSDGGRQRDAARDNIKKKTPPSDKK